MTWIATWRRPCLSAWGALVLTFCSESVGSSSSDSASPASPLSAIWRLDTDPAAFSFGWSDVAARRWTRSVLTDQGEYARGNPLRGGREGAVGVLCRRPAELSAHLLVDAPGDESVRGRRPSPPVPARSGPSDGWRSSTIIPSGRRDLASGRPSTLGLIISFSTLYPSFGRDTSERCQGRPEEAGGLRHLFTGRRHRHRDVP